MKYLPLYSADEKVHRDSHLLPKFMRGRCKPGQIALDGYSSLCDDYAGRASVVRFAVRRLIRQCGIQYGIQPVSILDPVSGHTVREWMTEQDHMVALYAWRNLSTSPTSGGKALKKTWSIATQKQHTRGWHWRLNYPEPGYFRGSSKKVNILIGCAAALRPVEVPMSRCIMDRQEACTASGH